MTSPSDDYSSSEIEATTSGELPTDEDLKHGVEKVVATKEVSGGGMDSKSLDDVDSARQDKLWTPGFIGLLVTQWLTAINDNVFRWYAIDIAKDYLANRDIAILLGSVGFVAPFLIFAAPAGFLADRFSKRNVIVACKVLEIVAMSIALAAVYFQNFWLLAVTVFVMGAQTALHSPAKSGILPEILTQKHLSTANGWAGLAVMSATIIGMFGGGLVYDLTGYMGAERNFWIPVVTLLGLAVVGTLTSLMIRKPRAANPDAVCDQKMVIGWVTFIEAARDLRELFNRRLLFYVAMGIVFFWTVAAVAQINVDLLSDDSGGVFSTDRTPLLICLVMGVALGNVSAGFLSRGRIELGLVPIGAFGIVFFAILLSMTPFGFYVDSGPYSSSLGTDATWSLVIACVLLGALGIGAGLFDVPLASYLQDRAPAKQRGSILSATNFLIFGGMMLAFLFVLVGLRAKVFPGDRNNIQVIAEYKEKHDPENSADPFDEVFYQKLESWKEFWKTEYQRIEDPSFKFVKNSDDLEAADKATPYLESETHAKRKEEEIENLTKDVKDPELQKVILAYAIWQELATRGLVASQPLAEGKAVANIDRRTFCRTYPKTRRLASEVYLQAGRQPLFSSRGIFFLLALASAGMLVVCSQALWKEFFRFIYGWFVGRKIDITLHGFDQLDDRAKVFVLHDGVDENVKCLSEGIKQSLAAVRWKVEGKQPDQLRSGWLNEVLVPAIAGKYHNARVVESRSAIKTLESGRHLAVPMFNSREIGLHRPLVPALGVLLHQCRQSGWDSIPVRFCWHKDSSHPKVDIYFGKSIVGPGDSEKLVQAMKEVGDPEMQESPVNYMVPAEMMVRRCKSAGGRRKIADSMGQDMTGSQTLLRSLVLRRLLRKHVLGEDEVNVGLLVPPSAGGVLANLALSLDCRTSINLNYTAGEDVLNACIETAGIKHVITTKKLMDKINVKLDAEVVFLEDLREKVGLVDKVSAAFDTYCLPAGALVHKLGIHKLKQDDVLTVIFTSGSTGTPKGVMLTHRNIGCVIDGIKDAVDLNDKDVIVGILPFFHSLGYSVTLWAVAALDIAGVYHFNPLESNQIGKITKKFKGTILLSTPTFLRSFIRRIDKEDFETLDVVVAGAEKLPTELCDAFETKFGVRPVEGYGATELAPLVSVNQPASRVGKGQKQKAIEGTVGPSITNVETKVLDLDTEETLPPGQPGMLWVKGPNVMKGYMGRDDLTSDVIVDGWYKTGDVAEVDEEGFIKITGRLSRFSKIGGEMVPHLLVEEQLNLAEGGDGSEMKLAVTSVPDPKKGEKLVVLHLELEKSVEDLRKALLDGGLPGIYVPAGNSFYRVDELPVLGTGKLDLKGLQKTAMSLAGE